MQGNKLHNPPRRLAQVFTHGVAARVKGKTRMLQGTGRWKQLFDVAKNNGGSFHDTAVFATFTGNGRMGCHQF